MYTREEFITREVARLAKEKGFDWRSQYIYDDDIDAPVKVTDHSIYGDTIKNSVINDETKNGDRFYDCVATTLYDFQHWLRQEHDIHVYANYYTFTISSCDGYYFHIGKDTRNAFIQGHSTSFSMAMNKGFLEALKLIK